MNEHLKLDGLRFCKIKRGTKNPYEKNWVNKPLTWQEIDPSISSGDNFGVLCGYGGLIVIDSDTLELKEAVTKGLPSTFRVKTGKGGCHDYYICKDLKKKIVLQNGSKHYGEVQAEGTQVVGPGSLHPNGNCYQVENDIPIAEITLPQLTAIIKPFMKEIIQEEKKTIQDIRKYDSKSDINSIPITSVVNISDGHTASNGEYYGTNPWHGSDTKMNFWINPSKNVAHCFRCNCGINVAQAIALNEGITSSCNQKLTRDEFIKVLDVAQKKYGLVKPEKKPEPKQEGEKDNLPEIAQPTTGKLITEFAQQLSEIIKTKTILFYRTNTKSVVEVGKVKLHKDKEESYQGFLEIKPNRFITLIEQFIIPGVYVYDEEKKEIVFKKKSIGSDLANTIICSEILQKALPQIERIYTIPLPIIYEDVLTFPKKGYDLRFYSWLSYDAPEITNLDMTLEEAKKVLNDLFKEFCFKTKKDRDMAIAALITPFLRGLFKFSTTRTPIFCYIANRERCGKDYCAGITGIVYEGIALEESPVSSNENAKTSSTEELRKKILAAMIMGRKRMHFSNNKGYINNATLEAVSTAPKWSDRVLGKNDILTFDNELDFSLSGNVGVSFTADFSNRSRFINFFLDIEDANSRTFDKPNLHEWVIDNRSLILSAMFTLVRNWINLGKPKGSVPFASFHEWSEVCGGVLESAGYTNPCLPDKENLALGGDYETVEMKKLFEYCYEKAPDKRLTRTEIKSLIRSEPELDIFAKLDFSVRADETRFGLLLTKFCGRILSEIKMDAFDTAVRSSRQEILFTKEKSYSVCSREENGNSQKVGNHGNNGNDLYLNGVEKKNHIIYNKGVNDTNLAMVTNLDNVDEVKEEKVELN